MRLLITGAAGGLGQALLPALAGHELFAADVDELDVTSASAVATAVAGFRPEVVIHCAAYTDVDGCARDPALAHLINAQGTYHVARACRDHRASLVHVSTNEVFAGDRPGGYEEWMPAAPVNPYGASKAAAEALVRQIVPRHAIVRTAWLYADGGRNFVHAILMAARRHGAVRVVADEVGNPTSAVDLAGALVSLVEGGHVGTFHLINEGACSRWAFAAEILRLAGLSDMPNTPILGRDYRRLSTPPRFAALHNRAAAALGIRLRPWPEALAAFLAEPVETAP